MNDNDIYEKLGAMHSDIGHIKKTIDGLNCSDNQPKINEMYGWYSEYKDIVKQSKITAIRSILTSVVAGIAAAAGIGYFK